MYSVRHFVGLWLGLSVAIVAYAFIDLSLTPRLLMEQGLSLRPDLSQVPDLVHWGGRLLRESRAALVANAIIIGGLGALVLQGAARRLGALARPNEAKATRVSIYTANSGPPSVS